MSALALAAAVTYATGFVAVWIFAAGAFFADIQESFPASAHQYWPRDLCEALLLGLFIALLWPVGWVLPIVLTSELEHGWYLLPRRVQR